MRPQRVGPNLVTEQQEKQQQQHTNILFMYTCIFQIFLFFQSDTWKFFFPLIELPCLFTL